MVGLSSAVVVCDRMLKTADVEVRNVENTKGGGLVTVSVAGDVAAVQAAVDSAQDTGVQIQGAVVLANPAEGIPELGKTDAFNDKAPFQPDFYRPVYDQNEETKSVEVKPSEPKVEPEAPKAEVKKPTPTKKAPSTKKQAPKKNSPKNKDNKKKK